MRRNVPGYLQSPLGGAGLVIDAPSRLPVTGAPTGKGNTNNLLSEINELC
jgi:hypothetical protein